MLDLGPVGTMRDRSGGVTGALWITARLIRSTKCLFSNVPSRC
jgi:hypothetical protein